MSYASPKEMAYDDEEILDRLIGPEGKIPDYPPGLCFSLSGDTIKAIGAEGIKPDDSMRFSAMGEVTSVYVGREDCRIELQVSHFAGPDGKFQELEMPSHLCLCGPELNKMELEADCERGDTIHLIGEARLEGKSDTEWAGEQYSFQVTKLTYEDESDEAREG